MCTASCAALSWRQLPGLTDQEAKRIRLEQAVVRLVETLAEVEGTPYFRVQITSGLSGSFDMVVEKRTKIVKPRGLAAPKPG